MTRLILNPDEKRCVEFAPKRQLIKKTIYLLNLPYPVYDPETLDNDYL